MTEEASLHKITFFDDQALVQTTAFIDQASIIFLN
jgi:hypothetical protein